MGESESPRSGVVLARLLDALERRYQDLPEGRRLSVQERERAERLVRLPGPWSLLRLREGLRAALTRSPAESAALDEVFAAEFVVTDEELRREPDTAPALPPPPVEEPAPVAAPAAPPPRRWWRPALAVALVVLVGVLIWMLRPPPPAVVEPAPPTKTIATTTIPPLDDPLAPWSGDRVPHPMRIIPIDISPGPTRRQAGFALIAAFSLLGLAILAWRVDQEELSPPAPPRFDGTDHKPLVLDVHLDLERLLPADLAGVLADAFDAVQDPLRHPELDLSRSISATLHHGGFPTEITRPPQALRQVVVVRAPGARRRPVDRALLHALATRGVPTTCLTWDRDLFWHEEGGAPTTVDRLTERDAAAIVLVVGEASRIGRPRDALAPFRAFPRAAWVELSDRRLWEGAVRAAQASLPTFGVDRQGIREMIAWVRDGTPPVQLVSPLRPRGELVLDDGGRATLERLLGEALPLAAGVAACILPAGEGAFWFLATRLGERSPELRDRLASLPCTAWDRLMAMPGVTAVGDALDLSDELREWLGGEVFVRLPSEVRVGILEAWLVLIEQLEHPEGSERAVEAQLATALLEWRLASEREVPLDEQRVLKLAAALRAAAAGRLGGRVARMRERRSSLLPALNATGLSPKARAVLQDALTGSPPPRWTPRRQAVAATFGTLSLVSGGDILLTPLLRPQLQERVVMDAEGVSLPVDLAWRLRDGQQYLSARVGSVHYDLEWTPDDLRRPGVVLQVREDPNGKRVSLCRDTESWPDWTLLRCASDGRLGPAAPDGLSRGVVFSTEEELRDPQHRRFMDLLLASGTVELVLAGSGDRTDLCRQVAKQEMMSNGDPLGDWDGGWSGSGQVYVRDVAGLEASAQHRLACYQFSDSPLRSAMLPFKALLTGMDRVSGGSGVGGSDNILYLRPLPSGPATFRCTDGAGRNLVCDWRARWEGLPETANADQWDLSWSDKPPGRLAAGSWTIAARPLGGEWSPQSVEVVDDRPIEVAAGFGAPTGLVTLPLPSGVTATLDGAPWDGDARELAQGRHALILRAGCGVKSRVVLRVLESGGQAGPGEVPIVAGSGALQALSGLSLPQPQMAQVSVLAGDLIGRRVRLTVTAEDQHEIVDQTLILVARQTFSWPAPRCGDVAVLATVTDDAGQLVAFAQESMEIAPEGTPSTLLGLAPPKAHCGLTPTGRPTGRVWATTANPEVPMRFLGLSGGQFCMGSPDAVGYYQEHPLHGVQVSGFLLGQSEVTQEQWAAVVRAAQAAGDADAAGLKEDPFRFKGGTLPAETVSWCQAARFANALSRLEGLVPAYTVGADCEGGGEVAWDRNATGFRLPTEAEWEYAARAGTSTAYATGDTEADLVRAGWYNGNGGSQTHSVCTAAEKPWGLCDLHGNVWEWIWDWYAKYPSDEVSNPAGPPRGDDRVLRGGSWDTGPGVARSAYRYEGRPSVVGVNVGFRLVLPAVPSKLVEG